MLFRSNVEATSVTPFSPRALDRALPAVLVALCRQEFSTLTPPRGAQEITVLRNQMTDIAEKIAIRAFGHRLSMSDEERNELKSLVLHTCNSLLDDWLRIAKQAKEEGSAIQYQREEKSPPRRLLREFLDPELTNLHPIQRRFRANRSMRDVESPVQLFVTNLNDWKDKDNG